MHDAGLQRRLGEHRVQSLFHALEAIGDRDQDVLGAAGLQIIEHLLDEVTAWQGRPLEVMYPVVFFDALRVKMREDGVVRNKAVYLALGVLPDGTRDILGLWIETTEGAKFWRNRDRPRQQCRE